MQMWYSELNLSMEYQLLPGIMIVIFIIWIIFLFVDRYNNIIANKENETDHGAHKNDSRQAVAVRSSIET